MNTFNQIYTLVWSIISIILGIYGVLFRKSFIKLNINFSLFLYKLTGFKTYEYAAKRMQKADI